MGIGLRAFKTKWRWNPFVLPFILYKTFHRSELLPLQLIASRPPPPRHPSKEDFNIKHRFEQFVGYIIRSNINNFALCFSAGLCISKYLFFFFLSCHIYANPKWRTYNIVSYISLKKSSVTFFEYDVSRVQTVHFWWYTNVKTYSKLSFMSTCCTSLFDFGNENKRNKM